VTEERAARLAQNEAIFRLANERMAAWEERHEDGERELYFCECGDADCAEKVLLTGDEYERVRSDPARFFVVPGHEIHGVESVAEEHDGWMVVVKVPEVRAIVEATNPRS
jgi:hypothetical protein